MKKKAFEIPTLDESLRHRYEAKKIDAKQVAIELYRAGWYNFVPDNHTALTRIGVYHKKRNKAR